MLRLHCILCLDYNIPQNVVTYPSCWTWISIYPSAGSIWKPWVVSQAKWHQARRLVLLWLRLSIRSQLRPTLESIAWGYWPTVCCSRTPVWWQENNQSVNQWPEFVIIKKKQGENTTVTDTINNVNFKQATYYEHWWTWFTLHWNLTKTGNV